MNIVTLDVNHPSWLAALKQLPHDVYHLPDYIAIDARRTKTLPEAFLLQENDKIFLPPTCCVLALILANLWGQKFMTLFLPMVILAS